MSPADFQQEFSLSFSERLEHFGEEDDLRLGPVGFCRIELHRLALPRRCATSAIQTKLL